jgi:esterase
LQKALTEAGSIDALLAVANDWNISWQDGSPPASGFVPSNGLRMHWLDWGHADKPAILFLHGARLTAHTWDLVCLQLRNDYHCIALDQRGHGLTDGVHSFGVEEPRADILGAVRGLALTRFAIVGMSLGGNNTIAYAGVHQEGLAATVFVDVGPTVLPAGYQDGVDHEHAIARCRSFDEVVEAAHQHNPRGNKAYKRYLLSHSAEPGDGGFWRMRHLRELPPARSAEETAAYMTRRRETLWSLVPNIRCPSLVVHAANSLPQTRENLEIFRSTLPNGALVQIPDATHDVQEDQPKLLAMELKKFFAKIGY